MCTILGHTSFLCTHREVEPFPTVSMSFVFFWSLYIFLTKSVEWRERMQEISFLSQCTLGIEQPMFSIEIINYVPL